MEKNNNISSSSLQTKLGETNDKRNRSLERVLCDFTDDLWIEVLLRLPLKPLIQFKSVSKSWFSIIPSHHFAKSHLHRAITSGEDHETLIIHHHPELDEDDDDYDVNVDEVKDGPYFLSHLSSCKIFEHLGSPYSQSEYPFEPQYSTIVGCDCGIVCVSVDVSNSHAANKEGDIYLWNPPAKLSKLIPPPSIVEGVRLVTALGFGFDHIGLDFKVVKVASHTFSAKVYSSNNASRTFSAEVYSSNTDAWRKIEPKPIDVPIDHTFHVCLHGFLLTSGHKGMMAFDLNKEVFICNIKLPVAVGPVEACIADFNDSISVCIYNKLDDKLKLWTLDDEACLRGGGVEVSWTIKLNIEVGWEPFDHVKGLFNSVEFLLVDEESDWFFYNFYKKEICGLNGYTDIFRYTKSLFSIVGSKPVKWTASSSILLD